LENSRRVREIGMILDSKKALSATVSWLFMDSIIQAATERSFLAFCRSNRYIHCVSKNRHRCSTL